MSMWINNVHVCRRTPCTAAHMWESDENSGERVLSLHLYMVSMDVGHLGLSSTHSSPLRHRTSPRPFEDLSFHCNWVMPNMERVLNNVPEFCSVDPPLFRRAT